MTESSELRVSVTRRISAPAPRIFAIVTSPQGHVDIDGSGMLVAAPGSAALRAVGDSFVMDMDREPLGDVPGMGRYSVLNTVTELVPDVSVAWTPGMLDRGPFGHLYGYTLQVVDETTTDVTSWCDWSGVTPKYRDRVGWPVVPVEMMAQSLERLDGLATS